MHASIHAIGQKFFQTYWRPHFSRILEIGSQDVNGSLRDFQPPGSTWTGMDLAPGKGVDVVLDDPHAYPFPDASFDMVVSTSCYEHDPMFWLTFAESCRVLAPTGIIYVNAPTAGVYHAWPNDHWRLWTDSGLALEKWGQRLHYPIRLVESFVDSSGPASAAYWNDLTMVFTKDPDLPAATPLADIVPNASDIRAGSAGDRRRPVL